MFREICPFFNAIWETLIVSARDIIYSCEILITSMAGGFLSLSLFFVSHATLLMSSSVLGQVLLTLG